MGAYTSKDFVDMLEEDATVLPCTPVLKARLVDKAFDPRSPTTEITRTPIHVDQTPEVLYDPRSPSVGITRTPIHHAPPHPPRLTDNTATASIESDLPTLDDPRSPAVDFTRTPIHSSTRYVTPHAEADVHTPVLPHCKLLDDPRSPSVEFTRTPLPPAAPVIDPRSPTHGIERTPIYCNLRTQMTEDAVEPLAMASVDDEPQPLDITPVHLETDQSEGSNSTEVVPSGGEEEKQEVNAEEEETTEPAEQPAVTAPVPEEPAMVLKRRKPKALFQSDTPTANTASPPPCQLTPPRSPLAVIDNTAPRSPLKVINNTAPRSSPVKGKEVSTLGKKVDVSSPRAIVQRKQANKLTSQLLTGAGASRSPARSATRNRSPARSAQSCSLAAARSSPVKVASFQVYEDKENM